MESIGEYWRVFTGFYLPVDKRVDGKKGECFQAFALGSKYIVVDAGGMFVYAICFNTQIWLWIR